MTNLQAQEPKSWLELVLTRERVLWSVPALVGGLAALGTGLFLMLPRAAKPPTKAGTAQSTRSLVNTSSRQVLVCWAWRLVIAAPPQPGGSPGAWPCR